MGRDTLKTTFVDGGGGVSSRSKVGLWSMLACLDPLRPRAVPQLTGWQVERSAHRAVDNASLETGVRVAKGNGGGHDAIGMQQCNSTTKNTGCGGICSEVLQRLSLTGLAGGGCLMFGKFVPPATPLLPCRRAL
jgi:hypothetical protein